jgi:NADPH2:quinone reductase
VKAVGYKEKGPIEGLQDITIDKPQAAGRDLLVKVHAVSVNPVDTKVRVRMGAPDGAEWRVLGFDASGVVDAAWYERGVSSRR